MTAYHDCSHACSLWLLTTAAHHDCLPRQVRRELHFMPSARLDGLKLRVEEFGKKTTQYYDGSKDNLIYRSASYKPGAAASADGGMPDTSQLRKMTEK